MVDVLVLRVLARHQRRVGYEFSSPEALKNYLHEHPKADPKNHSVKKHEEKPKKSWKDVMTGLSDKAKTFLSKAPGEVKKFVQDEGYRSQVLYKAHEAITSAPLTFVDNAWAQARHEVEEFKEAGEGVKSWMSGKAMSDGQKKAFKKVALHVALAAAAGALGAGIGAGAMAVSKGVVGTFISSTAKKIAAKAVTRRLEHLPAFHELGHIGHGVSEIMDKLAATEKDPEEVMKLLVAAAVAKELKGLEPETVEESLEDASGVSDNG